MKKTGIKFLAIFLAAAVLMSATGITVFQMVCSKSNKVYVSLDVLKNCCNEQKSNCDVKDNCCDFSSKTIKPSQLSNPDVRYLSFETPAPSQHWSGFLPVKEIPPISAFSYTRFTLDDFGRTLLNTTSRFNI